MKYIPLNIKTEYDLMNSLIKIDDLILYAKNNNINTLGITDTNMFGAYEFYTKCLENNIKPIIGSEININNDKLILYAINFDGYSSLCKIISKKNISELDLDYLISESNNLICVVEKDNYLKYKNSFKNIYISYNNENDKKECLLLSDNILYLNQINYFEESDKEYFKYLKYIEENKLINDEINVNGSYFINNNNEFDIETTIKFSNLINIEFPEFTYHIPVYREDAIAYLRALAKKGLTKRLNGEVSEVYINRLMYELSVIEKMNYVNYFLIVYDCILYAKKNNIMVGCGRGSGASSLVNYSLGITNMDPIKYNLIFERFLNPDRISMPDIDVDFDSEKRDEIIEYVLKKYGEDNVARIISFMTMKPKLIIRDVARVLNLEPILIDRLCKTIKNDEDDFETLKNNLEFTMMVKRNESLIKLIKICNKLCGLKKNTSMHAAGVVISDINLNTIMPMYKSNNIILTGYSKEFIESLGLLKMDFLAISNLSTLFNIINDIKHDNIDINIDNIDVNDIKTLNLFKNAYTTGIFQFERQGMKIFLRTLDINNFNTLVDALALYRPGPMENKDEYALRKKGQKKVTYLIPELESILKSTYGIIIYQEQVLEVLRKIGGYTYAEADIIRKAMSKKKLSIIENEKDKFINGVISKGYDRNIGQSLYDLIVKFSSYGFNKAHSVVYAKIAFQMAYLKVHYTKYFMKNLLNSNKSSDKLKEYIDESKILGINFKNIDINKSCYDFVIDDNDLVLPFSIIKSVAKNVSDEIEKERENGLFTSIYDFLIRCYSKCINKKVIISLIECGAFDSFNINKKQYINNIDEVLNYVSLCKDLNLILESEPTFDNIDDYDDKESIDNEIKNYGFYLSHHPVTKYDRENMVKLNNFKNYFNKTITIILYVENVKTIKTKNNDKMCFVTLSDEYDSVEGILFPEQYKLLGELEKNKVYRFNANVERRNNNYQLVIYNAIIMN